MQDKPCHSCRRGTMRLNERDIVIERQGLHALTPRIAGWFCDSCPEIDFDELGDSGERYVAAGDALVLRARALRSP